MTTPRAATTQSGSTASTPARTAGTTTARTTPNNRSTGGVGITSPSATTRTSSKPQPHPTHARVPATFKITAVGALDPPVISVPASLPIELTLVSGDGDAHHVVLNTPTPRTLSVPARGKASVLLTGVRKGTYVIRVDGATSGSLAVGAQVGP